MIVPLIIDKPYPQIDGLQRDYKTAKIISECYADAHSELSMSLQYLYYSFNFYRVKDVVSYKLIESIRLAEEIHLALIGKLIVKLGVDPIFTAKPPFKCDYFSTASLTYSKTPTKMVKDLILAEMTQIAEYKAMLTQTENLEVKGIIERIILDEELHLGTLKERLKKLNQKTQVNG